MVKVCAMGGCYVRASWMGDKDNRFFKFPKEINRRRQWASLCGRKDPATNKPWAPKDTTISVFLCAKHFVKGQLSRNAYDIDHLPSLFLPTETPKLSELKKERAVIRLERIKRRRLLATEIESVLESDPEEFQEIDTPTASSSCPELEILTDDSSQLSTINDGNEATKAPEKDNKDERIAELERKLSAAMSQNDTLESQNRYLEAKLTTVRFSSATIFENNTKSRLYTGLPWPTFLYLFNMLQVFVPEGQGGRATKIPRIDQFFYTLVKLKHNDIFEKLADHVGVGKSTMIDYFWKWVDALIDHCQFLLQWPDRDLIFKTIPPHFKSRYPRLTCIIDCFEIFIERPTDLTSRAQVYSTYKHHTTAKYLVGCTPLGAISFLSKGFGGRASDIQIVRDSGFINPHLHFPGDQILADRGFTFQQEMADVCGAHLLIPSFIHGKDQFTAEEVEMSRKLASVRIHIERVIGAVKNRFAILQQTIPLRLINSIRTESEQNVYTSLDKIVHSCAMLVNLENSIVYKD